MTTRTVLVGLLLVPILALAALVHADNIVVLAGGDVQAAINAAACGDTITLQAGANYPANLTLPNKQCAQFITIQSSRAGELPEGVRVGPTQAPLMAHLQSVVNAEPVIKNAVGAHHYRFVGVEISTQSDSIFVYDLVRFGEGRQAQATLESVPHHLVIDRSYVHGWPTQDVQRGVTLNGANIDITNSYISDIHGVGFDTQAVAGWNGTSTIHVINNYLEGAGENVMFGGADSASAELMPANIEIRRNYLFKPLSWKVGHPTYAGRHWTIKNLLELKNARNVVIDGNFMENNWTDGQAGVAVLFTVRNQECSAPWSTVQNVTYSNNTVRGSDGGALNFLGKDNEAELAYGKCKDAATAGSVRGGVATITNSLFYDIGGSFLTLNGFDDVSINRTTHTQRGNLTTIYGQPSQRFKYTNDLTADHDYGLWIEGGKKAGDPTGLLPGAFIEQNVVVTPYDKSSWPANNQFIDALTLPADFRSPFAAAGVDVDVLNAVQAGGVVSQPTPQPAPSPSVSPSPIPSPTPTPTVAPSPTATPTPAITPVPSPSPTPIPSPLPSPTPQPSPTATVLPICKSNQVVGVPPTCRCLTGMKGNSGKCR